ncbi:beta-glucanase/beta-glucan synthetase [Mycobacteroides abscessus subsp. abscessus]|nr:beta-glucanase/beta-glucan synthetase [Mycobacteroides abscessus subsp. abscessus]
MASRFCWVSSATAAVALVVAGISCTMLWSKAGRAEPVGSAGACPTTAAETLGWGAPSRSSEFSASAELDNWWLYDGPGHTGNGRRTPTAISVADGSAVITGDDYGTSGGMALKGPGLVHGRWEVCARSPRSAPTYHSVLLAWPDAENWPVGGEIDFAEITDPQRQSVEVNLHSNAEDRIQSGLVKIDATQWHSWAVEWTPDRIATYVDGVKWWETTDGSRFPPGPMHLCMQLDDFGGDTRGGGQLIVDWAREYRLP